MERPHYPGLTPGLETGRPQVVSLTWLAINRGLESKLAFQCEMSHLYTNKAVIFSLALSIIPSSPVPGRTTTITGDVTHSPTLITRAPAPRRGISHRRCQGRIQDFSFSSFAGGECARHLGGGGLSPRNFYIFKPA